ncbi:MAG TPA: hypothetical protein VHH88_12830, partial [Verrucomicrobiae bacterium]|nr:hypothetical protein [Verrucomicrobiae bacterium]
LSAVQSSRRATETVANAFFRRDAGIAKTAFAAFPLDCELKLRIKVPEGFAFYALYPEQYQAAAMAWHKVHGAAGTKDVWIVGIRSIGTTLSALVKVVLECQGWHARRCAIRPTGHPFDRQIELPMEIHAASLAIVVDEGPGLSGSSMAAVALALRRRGIPAISFFPAHRNGPGPEASDAVRRCWLETPVFAPGGFERRIVAGRSCKDLSGGKWRERAFASRAEWPAVASRFERIKFLETTNDEHRVLWKFTGFGEFARPGRTSFELLGQQVATGDGAGFQLRPFRYQQGFAAFPWVEGRRIQRGETDPALLARVAAYIAGSTGPALSSSEIEKGFQRLCTMLCCNSGEALGEEAACAAEKLAQHAQFVDECRAYTDGRMAPWEWLRAPGGKTGIVKTDWAGHEIDHTLVGRQPIFWDIAGVLLEWGLAGPARESFLAALKSRNLGIEAGSERFYCAAYAAFRLGVMTLAASDEADCGERMRLGRAIDYYREKLRSVLNMKAAPFPNARWHSSCAAARPNPSVPESSIQPA